MGIYLDQLRAGVPVEEIIDVLEQAELSGEEYRRKETVGDVYAADLEWQDESAFDIAVNDAAIAFEEQLITAAEFDQIQDALG